MCAIFETAGLHIFWICSSVWRHAMFLWFAQRPTALWTEITSDINGFLHRFDGSIFGTISGGYQKRVRTQRKTQNNGIRWSYFGRCYWRSGYLLRDHGEMGARTLPLSGWHAKLTRIHPQSHECRTIALPDCTAKFFAATSIHSGTILLYSHSMFLAFSVGSAVAGLYPLTDVLGTICSPVLNSCRIASAISMNLPIYSTFLLTADSSLDLIPLWKVILNSLR